MFLQGASSLLLWLWLGYSAGCAIDLSQAVKSITSIYMIDQGQRRFNMSALLCEHSNPKLRFVATRSASSGKSMHPTLSSQKQPLSEGKPRVVLEGNAKVVPNDCASSQTPFSSLMTWETEKGNMGHLTVAF
jgi:hypothetical protein